MEDVKSLILKFSKPELKYLKTLLNAFHGKSNENKMLELVELIEKKPDIQQAEASKKLYGDPKTKAFLVMKARLMERLYEVVLASPKIPNNPLVEEDENAYAYIQLQKDFALAIALRRRGLSNLSKEILQECLKNPHTHLNPSFKVMFLEYFRTSVDNLADLEQVNKDLEYAIPQQKLCIESNGFSDKLRILSSIKSFSKPKTTQFLSEIDAYLSEMLQNEKYYTPRTHINYLLNKLTLFNLEVKIKEAEEVLKEIVKMLEVYPHLAINNRKGAIYLRLAEINCAVYDYQNLILNTEKACLYYKDRPRNYWIAKCIQSCGYFYLGKWEMCITIYDALKQAKTEVNSNAIEILNYQVLCIKYLKGELKLVLQSINELNNAYSNKAHTNIDIRIFEIMILIDLGDSYFAELKIDALRKHIERYEVQARHLNFYKILNQLQLQSFDFQQESEKITFWLNELRNQYEWRAYSLEAIRFETWIEAHRLKIDYWQLFEQEELNREKITQHNN